MSSTIDAWIEGTYAALVRPKPRHGSIRAWVRCSAPVSFTTVDAEEAPIAIHAVERDASGRELVTVLRNRNGRLYRPHGHGSELKAFLEVEQHGTGRSYFRQGHESKPADALAKDGVRVLSDERAGFEARMHELAERLLIVDGIVHVETPEPVLRLTLQDGHPRLSLSDAGAAGTDAIHAIDAMDLMERTIAIVLENNPGAVLRNDIVGLDLRDISPMFDERHHSASRLSRLGSTMMSRNGVHRLDDDGIQAVLDLRRASSMPLEHVEERYDLCIDAARRFLVSFDRLSQADAADWRHYAISAMLCTAADEARRSGPAAELDDLAFRP